MKIKQKGIKWSKQLPHKFQYAGRLLVQKQWIASVLKKN